MKSYFNKVLPWIGKFSFVWSWSIL